MNKNFQVYPKLFSERMTAVLKKPASLDSETRQKLTNLPKELSDPRALDAIIKDATDDKVIQQIGRIFTDIRDFKEFLKTYNKKLTQELVQRRDLGCYMRLLWDERKKTHKFSIDNLEEFEKRMEKAAENKVKVEEMLKEPELPQLEEKLPDVSELFENEESFVR